ncbi:MAG: glycerophosphodiester phosphodiesterase [Sandaracinaceae bacterium]
MLLYAHRGAHQTHPENTLEAFEAAIAQGADGVELDVRTCGSGEVVVAHDPHFGRVAGRAAWVAHMPWAALRELDLGGGARPPLLDDAIDLVVGAGLALNVEVKGDVPSRRATARAVAGLLGRRSERERDAILLSSFDPIVLGSLGGVGVRRAFLFDRENTGLLRAALFHAAVRPEGLHPHHALCNPRRMRRWKRAGLFVNPWTVNDPDEARRLEALGVDGLVTDDVPALSRP